MVYPWFCGTGQGTIEVMEIDKVWPGKASTLSTVLSLQPISSVSLLRYHRYLLLLIFVVVYFFGAMTDIAQGTMQC